MIYLPNLEDYVCFVVRDSETIRAYKTMPQIEENVQYRDYYINSNYLYKDSVEHFNSYSTIPTCLDNKFLTNNFYYRNDFSNICIIFLCFSLIIFGIPYKLFKTFRKGAR